MADHATDEGCTADSASCIVGVCAAEVAACNGASHGYCDDALACREYQDGDPGSSCAGGVVFSNNHFVGAFFKFTLW